MTVTPAMIPASIDIDLDEEFPHLSQAPISEAVVEIRAIAKIDWEESTLRQKLEPLREKFPTINETKEESVNVGIEIGQEPRVESSKKWNGFELQNIDGTRILKIDREKFVYSQFKPYPTWEEFSKEALALWAFYQEMTKPDEVQRIGLRFINKILLQDGDLGGVMKTPWPTVEGLEMPLIQFFHQERYKIPGHPYIANSVRTIQRQRTKPIDFWLVVDIDVHVQQAISPETSAVLRHLSCLRWLKNKIFFGSIKTERFE